MARLVTILKRVAIAVPVLLLSVIIERETTVRSELEGSLAEGLIMAVACVFWCPTTKESRLSSHMRKLRL